MTFSATNIDKLCIDTIRCLSMDAVQKANSGHPGTPMAQAPAAYVLWTKFLRHNPKNAQWADRDRFVLSCGHASMLIYSLLHLTGYGLTLDDLKDFRQWDSKTPGHPGVRPHHGRRDHHRPAGPGDRQRRGHGHRRALAGGPLQPSRLRRGEPPHLRLRRRRLPDGGGRLRGRQPRRAPGPREAHRAVGQQPHHHRRQHRNWPSPRTCPSASRPWAGGS